MLKLNYSGFEYECGTDEAGRGCLAGPVTAAAVILPSTFKNTILNDSKKLTKINRNTLRPIIEKEALTFAYSHILPSEIDKINILNASILAMHQSSKKLNLVPEFIIVDGNKFKPLNEIPYDTIIKGDGKFLSIAAASVIAKTTRDTYMEHIHEEFPMENGKQIKGEPTKEHRDAIKKYGVTKYHRKSFRLLPNQLQLDL